MFLRALQMMIAGSVAAINLYNCKTGAIVYVMTVHYIKNITLRAVACGPCHIAEYICVNHWLLYMKEASS